MFARSNLGEAPSAYSAEVYSRAQRCAPSGDFWHDMWAALNAECFAYSPEGWEQVLAFKKPPAPPAVSAPPVAQWTKPPASEAAANATIDQLIKDQSARSKAEMLAFFRSLPNVGGDDPNNNTPTWLWAAVAIAAVSAFAIWRN